MKAFCAVAAIGLGLMSSMGSAYSQPYSGPGSGSGYGREYTGPGSGSGLGRCRTIIQRIWRSGERVVVRRRVCG